MKTNRITFLIVLLIVFSALATPLCAEIPDKKTEQTAEKPKKNQLPELFEKCDAVFTEFVDKNGDVDYSALRRKRSLLNDAIRAIQEVTAIQYLSWKENNQKAFLINAHNIFTLKLIIDNYPIKPIWYMINYPTNSMKHIESGKARQKIYFDIIKHEYTLSEIENELLLGGFEDDDESDNLNIISKFDDLRVIFTLSYASKSSAFLRNEAYFPDKLDEQLDDQVRKFLASDRGIVIDKENERVNLSGIFKWYKKYFLLSDYAKVKKFRDQPDDIRAFLNFIINYSEPDIASYLDGADYSAKKSIHYRWNLNDTNEK